MARKIKNPVVVTLTRARAEDLYSVLCRSSDTRLINLVGDQIDCQAGRYVVLSLSRKDALAAQGKALNDVQPGGNRTLTIRNYTTIEKAFLDAYTARLRASVGE